MKEINIAKVIVGKRKEKSITQDDLAAYIGVSKASVSKWETGQSYPDITFLPQLASYFNISVDDLIGYSPQMTQDDIKKLYTHLTGEFGSKPFEEVLGECHDIIKKYYSCFPLLLQMVTLLINHFMLARDKEAQEAILQEAIDLCRRIKAEDNDMRLLNMANSLEAFCCLILQRPHEVLDLLDAAMKPAASDETILASAYQMTGNLPKSREVLQVGVYQHLLSLTGILPSYLAAYQDMPERFEEILRRALALADVFELDTLNPGAMLPLYLTAAQLHVMHNQPDRALEMIGRYASICTSLTFPLTLHGDRFFDALDSWFADFDLGIQAPRDGRLIKRSMQQAIIENPAFAGLADQPQYKVILESMKSKLGGY